MQYDTIFFDGGIKQYLPTLRKFGWVQPLTDSVYLGDLEQPEIDAVLEALNEVDPFGYSLEMRHP